MKHLTVKYPRPKSIRNNDCIKVHPGTAHEGPDGKYWYSSTLSVTSALDGVGSQSHVPAALPPGKTRYPLYRRLGGPLGRSGRMRKTSPPPGFDPWTVQPIASRYTDWAIPAHPRDRYESDIEWLKRTNRILKEKIKVRTHRGLCRNKCCRHPTEGVTLSTEYVWLWVGPTAVHCRRGAEGRVLQNASEFIDYLIDYHLIKKNSGPLT